MCVVNNLSEVAKLILDTPCLPGCNDPWSGIYESPSAVPLISDYEYGLRTYPSMSNRIYKESDKDQGIGNRITYCIYGYGG